MKPALSSVDLLWGMLCLVQQRRFPMRLLVEFWWMRRGSVCGAKECFGITRRHVALEITRSLAFGEIGGMVIADLDPGEHMVRLAPAPLSQRKQHLEMEGVYAAHGDALRKLADEFDALIREHHDVEVTHG